MTSPPPDPLDHVVRASRRRAGWPSPGRRGGKVPSPLSVGLGRGLMKLPRSFYLRPTITVAKDLLGKYIVRRIGRSRLIGKIVEVEAYRGEADPASHAYRGMTERNKVMFEEGGHLYVYFTYGMHFCANVVTQKKGVGEAVLIRAVEPLGAIGVMRRKRGIKNDDWELTNGPAKFCEAFAIKRDQNGTDLLGDEICIAQEESVSKHAIARTTRIGIRVGKEKRWRFFVKRNRFVSKSRPKL